MDTILFVCTGNTCRSPMAEAIAQYWFDRGLLGDERRYLAASAGVAGIDDIPCSIETIEALRRNNLEFTGRSKGLTARMIRGARVVFCMGQSHVESARSLVADEAEELVKIVRLDVEDDIADPIGMGQEAYDGLALRLMELIPERLQEVLSHEDRTGIGSSRP